MTYRYIDTDQAMSRYSAKLEDEKIGVIALDIECESNRHEYGEKLCLVQIYDGKEAVLIDPFKVSLPLIKQILEERSIVKIMFDVAGDRAFLYKNCGIDVLSAFDCQVAVGLLPFENRDLTSVLKQTLGIDAGRNKKQFQQYNWNTRPLDPEAIAYAIDDVLHLFALKDRLLADIIAKGQECVEQFVMKNVLVQNKPHRYETRPKVMRSTQFKSLTKKEKSMFETLFSIRDQYARTENLPPGMVFPHDMLFALVAGRMSVSSIRFDPKIPAPTCQRIMTELQKVIDGEA